MSPKFVYITNSAQKSNNNNNNKFNINILHKPLIQTTMMFKKVSAEHNQRISTQ